MPLYIARRETALDTQRDTQKILLTVLLQVLLCCPTLWAYSGGSGTAEDPYQIANAQDLIELGKTTEDYDKSLVLVSDIDLSGHAFDRAVIAPDSDSARYYQGPGFSGHLNGNAYVIRNLRIEGQCYLGLFGRLTYGAVVSNLSLEAVDVQGIGDNVGGLVGVNIGSITSSFWDIETSGQVNNRGGLPKSTAEMQDINTYLDSVVEARNS